MIISSISDKIVECMSSNGVTSRRTKQSTPLPSLLQSKFECQFFFTGSLNSGTILHGKCLNFRLPLTLQGDPLGQCVSTDCWYCHMLLFFLFLTFFLRDLSMSAQRMVLIFTKEQCLVVRYSKLCWHSAKMTLFSSVVVNITLSIKKESSLKAVLCFSVTPTILSFILYSLPSMSLLIGLLDSQPIRLLETPRSLSVYVAVQFYCCFKFYFPLF